MHKIMEKTFELIDVMEESEIVQNLERYRERILNNRNLQELIQKGNQSDDEYLKLDIKRKLYQNQDYQGYMDCYNELMYLVMEINARYQKLIGKGSCYK